MNKYIETLNKTTNARVNASKVLFTTNTLEIIINTTMSLVGVYVLYYIVTLKW